MTQRHRRRRSNTRGTTARQQFKVAVEGISNAASKCTYAQQAEYPGDNCPRKRSTGRCSVRQVGDRDHAEHYHQPQGETQHGCQHRACHIRCQSAIIFMKSIGYNLANPLSDCSKVLFEHIFQSHTHRAPIPAHRTPPANEDGPLSSLRFLPQSVARQF